MKNRFCIKVFITTLLLSLSMSTPCFCLYMTGKTTGPVELPSAADWFVQSSQTPIDMSGIDWANYAPTAGIENPKAGIINNVSFTQYDDNTLLTNNAVWMTLTEQEQFNFAIKYLPQMNALLGLPVNYFPATNVHLMQPNDVNYTLACGYTDLGTKQVYININKTNQKNEGGWSALYALAHETRHLYQSTFNTIPYNANANLSNIAVYNSDPREIDANDFARLFVNAVLKNVGSNLSIQ